MNYAIPEHIDGNRKAYIDFRLAARRQNNIYRVMELIDRESRLMQCTECGDQKRAEPSRIKGKYTVASWRCDNGCRNPGA